MPLPTSGIIKYSMINKELNKAETQKGTLNDADNRKLAKVTGDRTTIKMSDFYGKANGNAVGGGSSGGESGWTGRRGAGNVEIVLSVPIGEYQKYKFSISGKIVNKCIYDWNNSSTNGIVSTAGSLSGVTDSKYETEWHSGGRNDNDPYPSYDMNVSPLIDMSSPPGSMNGQINLTGNVADLTSSYKQIYNLDWWGSAGTNDGRIMRFKVYANNDGTKINFKYGLYANTYDRFSYGIKYHFSAGAYCYV